MKTYKGSILVFALIVLSFILIAAFAVASVTLIEKRSSNISVNSTTAFQQADKGMEEFLQQIYKDLEQSATLDNVAEQLDDLYDGTPYICVDATSDDQPAYIGNADTEFIISAYREERDADSTYAGWNITTDLKPIRDCDTTTLAEVARFKVAGNHNTAVRAVFVKLRDSLTRGLLAHWAFDDRAINEELLSGTGDDINSFVAQDTSKNAHILTLCKIHSEDEQPVDIIVDVEEDTQMTIEEFGICAYDGSSGGGMIPLKRDDCDDVCDENGAWDEGIVIKDNGATPGAGEAIYFDGVDDVLMSHIKSTCDADVFNCTTEDQDKIDDLSHGLTISLWIKTDGASADDALVSRYKSNTGFQMTIDNSGKACFRVDNKNVCSDDAVHDGEWHHIVGAWQSGKKPVIIVDDVKKEASLSHSSVVIAHDVPLYMGASNDNDDATIEKPFKGSIDDVRIWNRALAESEIQRLCNDSQDQDAPDVTCYDPAA